MHVSSRGYLTSVRAEHKISPGERLRLHTHACGTAHVPRGPLRRKAADHMPRLTHASVSAEHEPRQASEVTHARLRTRPAPPRRKPDHMRVNSGGKLTFVSAEHEINSDERLIGCKSTPAHALCAAKLDQMRVSTRRELTFGSAKHQVQASVWSAHLRLSPARAPRVPTLRSWIPA